MSHRVRCTVVLSLLAIAGCRDGVTAATDVAISPRATIEESLSSTTYLSRTFVRDRGAPVTVQATADIPTASREVTLQLLNGTSSGASRVSSASILLNGRPVLLPQNFSDAVAGATLVVPIGSERPVTLEVQLQGAPEAFVHIRLLAGVPLTAAGGSLSLSGGAVTVVAPEGAVAGSAQITADPVATQAENGELTIFEFGPDGAEFAKPLTITLPYDPAALPAGAEPALFWRRDAASPWQRLQNARYDATAGTATGEIDHFTQIGVLVNRIRVCPNQPNATPTIDAAYPLIARGGEIQLCDAVHAAPSVELQKSVSIAGTGSSRPILESSAANALVIAPPANDTIIVRNVEVRGHTLRGILAVSRGGYIEIDGLIINDQGAGTIGVQASRTAEAMGAYIIVRNSTISGGSAGLFAVGSVGSGRVDFVDNTVSTVTTSGIQYQGRVSNGTARGNRVSECGTLGCLRASFAGNVTFQNNTIVSTARPQIGIPWAISTNAIVATVVGNTIEGLGEITDRTSVQAYPFRDAAILISASDVAATAIVNGNVMSGGARGLQTSTNVGVPLTVVGADNIIRRSRDALAIRGGSRLLLRRSDISDYASAVFYEFPAALPAPLQPTDLACNWWGTTAGPASAFGLLTFPRAAVATSIYLPIATSPIAGQSNGTCTF